MLVLLIIVLQVVAVTVTGWLFRRTQPNWPAARIIFLSALPIPLIVWGLCIFVFVKAATASKETCGVDACGMAIAAAMFTAMGGLVLYVIGLIVAAVVVRIARPPAPEPIAAIFE